MIEWLGSESRPINRVYYYIDQLIYHQLIAFKFPCNKWLKWTLTESNNAASWCGGSSYTPVRSLKVVSSIASFFANWRDGRWWWCVFSLSSKCADRIEISSRFANMLETTKANEVPSSSNVNCIFDKPFSFYVWWEHNIRAHTLLMNHKTVFAT